MVRHHAKQLLVVPWHVVVALFGTTVVEAAAVVRVRCGLEEVFQAYSRAKQLAYARLQHKAWFEDSLPWVAQEFEETRKAMGGNYWSYGLTPDNRKTLKALFQYSREQGLASRLLTVEELFHPASLEMREVAAAPGRA